MWSNPVAAAIAGALVGVAAAMVTEALHLALRRRRNARFLAAGELPYKDEVFRPKWLLLGATGMVGAGLVRSLGAPLYAAAAVALIPPAMLLLVGLWFLRR